MIKNFLHLSSSCSLSQCTIWKQLFSAYQIPNFCHQWSTTLWV